MGFDREPEPVADLVLEALDFLALELDDPFAILADYMIVVRMLGVIGVVKLMILAKIHFADQPALGQQRQRAIHRRARNRSIAPARPLQKLLGGEMLARAESGLDDRLALGSQAQVFLREKIHEPPLGASVACFCHARSIKPGRQSSQSANSERGTKHGL